MINYSTDERQFHIGLAKGDVGEYVILPGDPGRCEKIAKYFDDAKLVAENREFKTYTGYLNGTKVSVVSTGIGGPSASICMEELVECGCHTFIRTGTCGGMQEDVLSGNVAISTGCIRQEGTTREYAPIEFPAVPHLDCTNALIKACKQLNQPYNLGITQSKDAFYGQHRPETLPNGQDLLTKWDAWKKLNCMASEMEGAALCMVAQYRKVRFGACFLVMANQTRAELGLDNPICRDIDRSIKVAVEAIKILIDEDKKK